MKLHSIWASICLLAALVAGISVYGWQQRKVGAQNALLTARTDSQTIARQALADSQRVWAHRDSLKTDSLGHLMARVAASQQQATRVAQLANTLTTQFRARLADSLQAGFDSATAMLRNVIAADSVSFRTLWDALALSERRSAQKDSQITALNASLVTQVSLTDAWQKAAHPGLFAKAKDALPWMAAAYVVGRLQK